VKERLKRLVMRLMRPGLVGVEARVESIERALDELGRRLGSVDATVRRIEGPGREKYAEELGYWRWLFKTDEGRAALDLPPEESFAQWQRERLRELAQCLGLAAETDPGLDAALDDWCARQSVVEIGAGPYPAVAAAPRWRRAVAVDPIARGYAEEGLLPASADHVTYIEAPGERVPLPAGCADLVIIENALDHVTDPGAVLAEIFRLLRPGGLLWLLVDLSTYSDHMHPHPFDEARIKGMLRQTGFEGLTDRVSDHKSHPQAYGEYRGLLRRPMVEAAPAAVAEATIGA
jgi:hypothetical protein